MKAASSNPCRTAACRTATNNRIHGHLNVVQYLCELPPARGVDPAADDNYALRLASGKDHKDIVRFLVQVLVGRGVET